MKHIASLSFGKDSIATVLLALEHGEPLDGAVFAEVMFDSERGISGEIPEHIEWIYSTAIPKLAELGCKVDVVRSQRDYMYFFTNAVGGGQYAGKLYGFPIGGRCVIQRDCKITPIFRYYKQFNDCITQYVGIALDEPIRLARMKGNQVSLLAKYGYTEEMAKRKCEEYGLLSPIYETRLRGGCWFCMNCRLFEFIDFRKHHPDLWAELRELSTTPNLCSYGFKYGKTLQDVEKRMDFEERQLTLFEL